MKNQGALLFLGVLLLIALLPACTKQLTTSTYEQAEEIAENYFKEVHGKQVVVEEVTSKQVSENQYLTVILSSEGEAEYELVLDEENRPLADNAYCIEAMRQIDIPALEKVVNESDFAIEKYNALQCVFSHTERRYQLMLSVNAREPQQQDAAGEVFSLLEILKKQNIDLLTVTASTPDFLQPRIELGHGTLNLQLSAEQFDTGIEEDAFQQKYESFSQSIYWERQKFDAMISKLEEIGYKNAYFYIAGFEDGATISIVLYCQSQKTLSLDQAKSLLEEIDSSCFSIKGKHVKYVLEHQYLA